jgi:signal transduction histidine kinase
MQARFIMLRSIRTLLFFIFVVWSVPLIAKGAQPNDTISVHNQTNEFYLPSSTNLDSALSINRKFVEKAQKENRPELYWDASTRQATLLAELGYRDSALLILNNILKQVTSRKDTVRQIITLNKLADCHAASWDFEQAIKYLLKAQKLLTNRSDFALRFKILNTLGQTHRKMKDYTNALNYYGLLEKDFLDQLDTTQKFLVYLNTGNVYLQMLDYKKTEEYYNKAYAEIQKIDDPANKALIIYNLGNLYFHQKHLNEANSYTKQALDFYNKLGDPQHIEFCSRLLGAIQFLQKNYAKAEKYYINALNISLKIDDLESQKSNYKNLYLNSVKWAQLDGNINRYKAAIAYQKKFSDLRDSMYQTNLTDQLLELEKRYETEKKNAQIELLAKENQLKAEELVIEQQQHRNMLIIIGTLILITIIIAYFVIYYRRFNRRLQTQSRLIFRQKEQIANQNVQLQKAMHTRDKLFSIIAHDLRSPLVSVSNFVRLLNFYLRDGKYDSIQRMAADMGKKNEQVLELTDNLLKWARSQSDGMKVRKENISLNEILDECLELYLPVAENKNITLTINQTSNCLLWTDRDMLRTICRNLINNAIKFTPRNGKVSVSYICDEKYARVSVTDTGIGINKSKISRLFNPEKSDVQPGTEGEKSSGLGLSVCQEFCRIMDGNIQIESTEGQGSTFRFSIPRYPPEKRKDNQSQPEPGNPAPE